MFVLLLGAALVCIRLGAWQLDRAAIRGAERIEAQHAERIAADPVPLEEALTSGSGFRNDLVATHVTARGTYEPDGRRIVPGRQVDGEAAALVVEPLRLTAGPDAGAVLAVVRGWLPTDDVDLGGDEVAQAVDPGLDPPAGEVTLTGHLGGSEAAASDPTLPQGTVASLSTAQLTGLWGGPGFSAYLVLDDPDDPDDAGVEGANGSAAGTADTDGAGELRTMSPPAIAEDTGLNVRNLFYALEWLVFGGFALALWVRMVRDEVHEAREDALLAAGGAVSSDTLRTDADAPDIDDADVRGPDGADADADAPAR